VGRTPTLPPETPSTLNGWAYDPEPYNGNAWFGPQRQTAVFVYPVAISNETALWLKDERLSGINHVELLRSSYDHAVGMAVEWMQCNAPANWSHPRACEAVFDLPSGWSFERHTVGARQDTIRYRRDDPPDDCRAQLLQVQGYRSTGNFEFGIVERPTERRAHVEDLLDNDVPEDSSLDVALAMAFDLATDIVDGGSEPEPPTTSGQTTFSIFQTT